MPMLSAINDQIKKLTITQNSSNISSDISHSQSTHVEEDDKIIILKEARTFEKIFSLFPEIVKIDTGVQCKPCDQKFKYEWSLGVDFSDKTMDRTFSNLKKSLVLHFKNSTHAINVSEVKLANKRQSELLSKARENGITCASLAYNCIYDFSSYTSYEHNIASVYSAGGNVGIKNHSKEFPRLFLPALYDTLRNEFSGFMKANDLPFGILADKMTVSHRSRHIVGMRIPIWDISSPNIVKDVYLQCSSVKKFDGYSISNHLLNTLEAVGFNRPYIAKHVSGLAMDGQYTKLNFDDHFNETLETNTHLSWDPMHTLQLAYDDSNKLPGKNDDGSKKTKYKFIDDTIETMTAVSKIVKSGQGFEILLSHKDLLEVFYVPKVFKTMKFVSYSKTVFKTFLNNYPAYIATLQDNEEAALRDDLMSPEFITDLSFLSDVCSRIAHCSQQVQLCGLLPWKYPGYIESLKTDLKLLREILEGLEH